MFPRIIIALAFLIAAGCASVSPRYTQWPYRGPMMMVRNPTRETVVVLARDGTGRELITARLHPHSKQVFRGPCIHAMGYWGATGSARDTLTSEPFQPWSADGWEWSP